MRAAERVPKSKKLIKMTIFTGDEERTIVAGIGTKYTPEELVGRKVVVVTNLQPAKLMGVESNGGVKRGAVGIVVGGMTLLQTLLALRGMGRDTVGMGTGTGMGMEE